MPPGTSPERTNEVRLQLEELVARDAARAARLHHRRRLPVRRLHHGRAAAAARSTSSWRRPASGATCRPRAGSADLQEKINELGIPGAQIFVRPPRIRGLRTNLAGSRRGGLDPGRRPGRAAAPGRRGAAAAGGRFRASSGVELSTEEASPQLSIEIDRQRAADLGLDVAQVGQTVRTALDGTDRHPLHRAATTSTTSACGCRASRSPARRTWARSPSFRAGEQPIYLRDVADVRLGTGPTTILRVNQNRQLRVTGDVDDEIASVGEVSRGRARRAGRPARCPTATR